MLELLFVLFLILAPVPKDIPPATEITAGRFECKWGGSNYVYWFEKNGELSAIGGGWKGFWEWDTKTRQLKLIETDNDWTTVNTWVFQMEPKSLEGTCIQYTVNGNDHYCRYLKVNFRK
jgi:hypothetical protein